MTYDHINNDNESPKWEAFKITIGVIIVFGLIALTNYLMIGK